MRLIFPGQLHAAVVVPIHLFTSVFFLLTRRSWSLRKRPNRLVCASRSTIVWEESLSRRWASPPRSAPTPAGLKPTSYPLRRPMFTVFSVSWTLSSNLFPESLSVSSDCPTRSFIILHHAFPKNGDLDYWTPTCSHILHPAHYLNHCIHVSMVTAAVSMEIPNNL